MAAHGLDCTEQDTGDACGEMLGKGEKGKKEDGILADMVRDVLLEGSGWRSLRQWQYRDRWA